MKSFSMLRGHSILACGLLTTALLLAPFAEAQAKKVTVAAGTTFLVRMIDGVDSTKNHIGDRFTASLEANLMSGDTVVARKGATLYGRLAEAKSAGRVSGKSSLTLEITDISIGGTLYPLLTSDYELAGKGSGGKTAKRTVGGAGLGALIGAIAGGGKGAAIGAAAGGGVGMMASVLTKGEKVNVPSETLLEFRLMQSTTLPIDK
jgi:hypothetical protein